MEQHTADAGSHSLFPRLFQRLNLRFQRAVRRLDVIIYSIIRHRRATCEDTGDLLSMLHTQDEDSSQMTDQQLRGRGDGIIPRG